MAQWLRFKKGDGNALTTEEVAVEKFGKPSSKLHKILRRKVTHEEALRVLIETYPEILPWKDWNPDTKPKFLVICRGQKRCATDLVLLEYWPGKKEDNEARFVIVETKLASNHEINREVVGQVLEYRAKMVAAVKVAAELASSDQENLRARAKQYWNEQKRQLDDVGKEKLGQNWEDIFKQALAAAQKGDIRLVIASDEVPASLTMTIASLPAELLLSSVTVQVHNNTAISEYPIQYN